MFFFFFFFNDTATTEIYTLSLHDALPISTRFHVRRREPPASSRLLCGSPLRWILRCSRLPKNRRIHRRDRKSTRLNSSHLVISYAVFCLKKKKKSSEH